MTYCCVFVSLYWFLLSVSTTGDVFMAQDTPVFAWLLTTLLQGMLRFVENSDSLENQSLISG